MADFCVQKRSLFHKNGPICRFFYSRGSYIAFKLTYHGAFRLGRAVCERVGFPGEGPLEHQACAHAHHGLKPRRLPGVQFLRSTLKQRKHLTEKGLKISCERWLVYQSKSFSFAESYGCGVKRTREMSLNAGMNSHTLSNILLCLKQITNAQFTLQFGKFRKFSIIPLFNKCVKQLSIILKKLLTDSWDFPLNLILSFSFRYHYWNHQTMTSHNS